MFSIDNCYGYYVLLIIVPWNTIKADTSTHVEPIAYDGVVVVDVAYGVLLMEYRDEILLKRRKSSKQLNQHNNQNYENATSSSHKQNNGHIKNRLLHNQYSYRKRQLKCSAMDLTALSTQGYGPWFTFKVVCSNPIARYVEGGPVRWSDRSGLLCAWTGNLLNVSSMGALQYVNLLLHVACTFLCSHTYWLKFRRPRRKEKKL